MMHNTVVINIYPSPHVAHTLDDDNQHPDATPKFVLDTEPDYRCGNDLKNAFEDVDDKYGDEDNYKHGDGFDNGYDADYQLDSDDAPTNASVNRTDDESEGIHSDGQSLYDSNHFTESDY